MQWRSWRVASENLKSSLVAANVEPLNHTRLSRRANAGLRSCSSNKKKIIKMRTE